MVLLLYTSIEIPYSIAFGRSTEMQILALIIDAFLFIDIWLNFHTAFYDQYDALKLVSNKQLICKKYLSTWFIIDLLTCVPFELILANTDKNSHIQAGTVLLILRILRFSRVIKILRLVKMFKIFNGFMRQIMTREVMVFVKLLKIIFGMLMCAHFAACLWWYVGAKHDPSWIDEIEDKPLRTDEVNSFVKYSYAWYWANVFSTVFLTHFVSLIVKNFVHSTLFTTGYGDITATNTVEQWVSSLCILVGTLLFAYFISTLTNLISEGDKISSYESDKLEEAHSFCQRKKLPKEMTHAILTHIRYHCSYNYLFDESELLNILPAYLQHDIHAYCAKQFLLNLPIFSKLPVSVIGLIALKTKSISCNQSYKLYDVNDMAKEFYIQRTGKSIMYDKDGRALHHLSRGDVCGEYSSFLFKRRKLRIECETWSEYYAISVDDVKEILEKYFPKSSKSKLRRIQRYLKSAYHKNIKHYVDINHVDEDRNDRRIKRKKLKYRYSIAHLQQYQTPLLEPEEPEVSHSMPVKTVLPSNDRDKLTLDGPDVTDSDLIVKK